MPHQSEDCKKLSIKKREVRSLAEFHLSVSRAPDVSLLILPYCDSSTRWSQPPEWLEEVCRLSDKMHDEGVLCILTSPSEAARIWPLLEARLRFQLWVAVKIEEPLPAADGLPQHHAALLVASKYRRPIVHTKTRIAYTFCPWCDKTTKDYGGKKHTYASYGTLMSDVWRDISWAPGTWPEAVVDRLSDVFGLDPYKQLRVYDLTNCSGLGPSPAKVAREAVFPEAQGIALATGLRNGDCLDELSRIPDDSVDFCFADPPYNIDKKYDNWHDAIDITQYFEWCDTWLSELARVLKPGRSCAILNIPLWAIRHFQFLETQLDYQRWIVWEGLSLPVRMIMPAHYSIVCFSKGTPRKLPALSNTARSLVEREALATQKEDYCLRASCKKQRVANDAPDTTAITDLWWDIHRLKHNSRRADHPCQLPPALMRRLISLFTLSDEVVLDPFNGAGTTTLCSEQLGRRSIGIELSETYHQIALRRHTELGRGIDPFAKIKRKRELKSKNSRVRRMGGKPYVVPKKTLQLDVRRIARSLGRLPTREEVESLSKYPIEYFDEYFASWGEVCAAARTTGMSEDRTITTTSDSGQPTLF